MSKTALLELSKLAGAVPGRVDKIVWPSLEGSAGRPGSTKEDQSSVPNLAARLRERLSSLTSLEAAALFTLIQRRATGEDTLLKCAAGETGVSEALIVKIAKKLGFEGFRQLREALGEHNRLAQADLHEELCVADGACARLQRLGARVA
jgi:Helix-turn-helix domain, rpiR family